MAYLVGLAIASIIAYFWGDRGLTVFAWAMAAVPVTLILLFFYFLVLPSQFWANL